MSRNYGYTCIQCRKDSARKMHVFEDIELYQCMGDDCGACFEVTRIYRKLEAKGTSLKIWNKAVNEIAERLDETT